MTTQKINQLLTRYLQLTTEYNKIEKELKAVKEELHQIIGDNQDVETNKYIATCKIVESSRFDSTQYKKDHPKIYQNYMVNYSYPRIKVEVR